MTSAVIALAAPQAALASPAPSPAPSPVPSGAPVAAGTQAALERPDDVLGTGWRGSADTLVTGVGDTNGFHLYVAREKDAFAWSTLATLTSSTVDLGPWAGNVCVTGDGRYAVAVYAPAVASNRPSLLQAGGFAAVVDIRTGTARRVAAGVQLAYYDPACGPGDRALLTRGIGDDGRQTDLLTVDAAAGKVIATRHVNAQLTTPAPGGDADYGIVRGAVVRVDASGRTTPLFTPDGQTFALRVTARSDIDVLSARGSQAVAQRYSDGRLTRLGTAGRTDLQLFGLAGGRDAIVGDTANIAASGTDLTVLPSPRRALAVSQQGDLMALNIATAQESRVVQQDGLQPARPQDAGRMTVTVRATRTGRSEVGTVTDTRAPTLDTVPAVTNPLTRLTGHRVTTPSCAVPRNDPHLQVPQPSSNQVEWAVDMAVHGQLTVSRPANYLNTGEPAYTPQGMFGKPSMTVPAQVMLGIVAQESNLAQASWHAVPGDSGNPLIADYYGDNFQSGLDIDFIDYNSSDCGYGVSQVTDGMFVTDVTNPPPTAKQVAIATDYAANIAEGLQILIQKWNQLQAEQTYTNDDDSRYIENWYMAIWAYNSGVHLQSDNPTDYGVGWLNNPANPTYPADRQPFLRDGSDDANHPWQWPYQEKVMGWIEHPQLEGSPSMDKYSPPTFGASKSGMLELPEDYSLYLFCGNGNDCNPANTSNPCPNDDQTCWFHGTVAWTSCASACAVEYTPMSGSEPPVNRIYSAPDCTRFGGSNVKVVDDLDNSSLNVENCPGQTRGGKFTLRGASPPGADNVYYSRIDLHQLGTGYLGHIWFTHTYDPATVSYDYSPDGSTATEQELHEIVGTWSPDLSSAGNYDVLVHIPSHGGQASAEYDVFANYTDSAQSCTIDQSLYMNDLWVYLGNYQLDRMARVEMNNLQSGADGSTDIAYDAMAFVPTSGASGHKCGDLY